MWALSGKRAACAAGVVVAIAAGALIGASGLAGARPAVAAPAKPRVYEVGKSYLSIDGFIEYFPGDAPVILTAPHGGGLKPGSIPDRTKEACGGTAVLVRDTNTAELVLVMRQSYHDRYGTWPHVVINRLARVKFDANRPLEEAACGNAEAAKAFTAWHAAVDMAKAQVVKSSGRGWYMDIHGHGHEIQRLELGYLVKPADLNATDAELDANVGARDRVSIAAILKARGVSLSEALRGPASLGALYARAGFPSIPGDKDPRPGEAKYFNGGYNTSRHTCGAEAEPLGGKTGTAICGMQIESNYKGVRDTAESRKRFGDATAQVLGEYLAASWGLDLEAEATRARARR